MIKLDFDGKVFELYVDLGRKNWAILSRKIGNCNKRRSKGCWSVPNNYWTLCQVWQYYGHALEPTPAAQKVLDDYTRKYDRINELLPDLKRVKELDPKELNLEHDFKGNWELYEHQKKMFYFAKEFLKLDCGFAFWAQPGTGKSAPAVNVIEFLIENGYVEKVLVVTPASIKYNFAEQMEEHCGLRGNVLVDYKKDRRKGKSGRRFRWTDSTVPVEKYYDGYREYMDRETNSPVQIVNYKCVAKLWDHFKDYDLVVCDEFHYAKHRTSNRSKGLSKLRQHVPKFLAMTATPITKNPLDLYSQIEIMDPDLFPNRFDVFRDKVAVCIDMEVGKGSRTIKHPVAWKEDGMEWLNETIYTRGIRYTMDECLDLPEKNFEKIHIEMPKKLQKFYKTLVSDKVVEFGKMGSDDYAYVDASNGLVVVTYARQLSAGFIGVERDGKREYITISDFKVQALKELLENLDGDEPEQCIIWYKHKHVMRMITDMLDDWGEKSYRIINGDADALEKGEISSNFRKGKFDYIVASVDVTEGWQGQSARYAVFMENNYTFDKREQAEGRTHRKGQENSTVFFDIVANGSLDQRILKGIQEGESLSDKVLFEEIFEEGESND